MNIWELPVPPRFRRDTTPIPTNGNLRLIIAHFLPSTINSSDSGNFEMSRR